jgi:hypothetical protein
MLFVLTLHFVAGAYMFLNCDVIAPSIWQSMGFNDFPHVLPACYLFGLWMAFFFIFALIWIKGLSIIENCTVLADEKG